VGSIPITRFYFFIVTVQPVSAVVVGLFFCNGEEPNPGLAWELDGCLRFRNASFIASGDYPKEDVKSLCYTGFSVLYCSLQ